MVGGGGVVIVRDGVEYITAREYAAESNHHRHTIRAAHRSNLGGLADTAIVHERVLHFARPQIKAWRAEADPKYHPPLPVLGPDGGSIGVYPADTLAIEYQRPGLRREDDYDHLWGLVGPDGLLSAWMSPEAALLAAHGHTRERPVCMRREGEDRFILYAAAAG